MKQKLLSFKFFALILLAGLIFFQKNLTDLLSFYMWWFCLFAIGFIFLPVADLTFGKFRNKGYIFAKVLGLGGLGYLQWLLSSLQILPFRAWSCFLIVFIFIALNLLLNKRTGTYQKYFNDGRLFKATANQEALFMFLLLIWSFLRALKPEIEGLEKYMDFGFMNAILRSDYFPPVDMWLAGETINYYYLGQYYSAFLTKLTFINSAVTYNLMMATLFALSFMLVYSIVEFLIELFEKTSKITVTAWTGSVAGLIGGTAVTLAGNLHAAFYGFFFTGLYHRDAYWLSDATRYIGHYINHQPAETKDQTIHEFPVYSFIVSDLHAHVINMLFVLTVIGLVVSLATDIYNTYHQDKDAPTLFSKYDFFKWVGVSFLLMIFFIGQAPALNFWDFPIYVVFLGAVCLYVNLRVYQFSFKSLYMTLGQISVTAAGAYLVTLPFHLNFDSMGAAIKMVSQRSILKMMFILWGYQIIFALILTWVMVVSYQRLIKPPKKGKKAITVERHKNILFDFIDKVNFADGIVFVIFVCAIGLIIIPEIIYIQDIYPDHPRANTMFKLGFQAYILFGIGVGYTAVRILAAKFDYKKLFVGLAGFLLICSWMYPYYSIERWHGALSPSRVQGLDGTTYMLTDAKPYKGADYVEDNSIHISADDHDAFVQHMINNMPHISADDYASIKYFSNNMPHISMADDHALIQYINNEVNNNRINGITVIAEANGDPYTVNGRISANTGLQNIFNWYWHEMLWRDSDTDLLHPRRDAIDELYKTHDNNRMREIINKYNVEYIVVGLIERMAYPELNEDLLRSMGEEVFRSNNLYMIRVK